MTKIITITTVKPQNRKTINKINIMTVKELQLQSEKSRRRLIKIIYSANAGHTGGDLSCLNVMTALYFHLMNIDPKNPKMEQRDRFVLSKGHCVEALYVTLEARGFIKKDINR